jgi:two-component system response regulator
MMAIPPRLAVLLVENDSTEAGCVQNALEQLEITERLIVLPDGQRTVAYLLGRGKYSDRLTWPLPGVLVLEQNLFGLSGFDIVRWVRSEPCVANIPAVILKGQFSAADSKRAALLKAACCVKGLSDEEPDALAARLEQSMTRALNLVRRAWFNSRAAYGVPEFQAIGESPAIRVWT